MLEMLETTDYANWLSGLRDVVGRKSIARRIALLKAGHFGDVKSVGAKVSELRVNHGPGYRIYFTRRGTTVIVLLAGGDKDTQDRDIAKAKAIAATLE